MATRLSPDFHRFRMCERKWKYGTRELALRAANGRAMRAYLCPYCKFWHLTKKGQDDG